MFRKTGRHCLKAAGTGIYFFAKNRVSGLCFQRLMPLHEFFQWLRTRTLMPCHEYKFFLTKKTLESFHNYGYRVNEGYGCVVFSQVSLVTDASEKHLGRDSRFFILA